MTIVAAHGAEQCRDPAADDFPNFSTDFRRRRTGIIIYTTPYYNIYYKILSYATRRHRIVFFVWKCKGRGQNRILDVSGQSGRKRLQKCRAIK